MSYLIHFAIAYGLSFIGSLPFGMINMTVAYTAIQKGMRYAIWTAAGAALIEFIQVFIALKFTWLFSENAGVERIFQIIATIVFFIGGIYFFFLAKAKSPTVEMTHGRRRNEFFKGLMISSLNVMVIPYWIFYATLLSTNDILVKDNPHVFVFSAGTMLGTFSLLIGYALLGARILSRSVQITKWVNKFIGLLLFGFGVYQLIGLWSVER